MNSWVAEGKYDCNFLCVCVLGSAQQGFGLAKEFANELKLTHVVNAFVENQGDMPNYGQLGCQGFIILDRDHKVVSAATSPFMQVRELAFLHVEALIDALCANKPVPSICPGEYIELVTAPKSHPDLLGVRGICVQLAENDMVGIGMQTGPLRGKMIQVPVTAVQLVDEDESEDGGGDAETGGCGNGNCGGGKCDKAECGGGAETCTPEAQCDLDSEFVAAALNHVSVKVPAMDAEHDECSNALRKLTTDRSREALQEVFSCLKGHFEHEEALFEEFGFGNHVNEAFSAKKTHIEDHHRILDKLFRQVASTAPGAAVKVCFIKEVLQDFQEHTSRYDVQYSSVLGGSQGGA